MASLLHHGKDWLAMERRHDVRVCFSAVNLVQVASAFSRCYERIIICADNDRTTSGNPGLTKALEAAKTAGGRVALATFADNESGTDFNDIHQSRGLDEVRLSWAFFMRLKVPVFRC
ncbi:hypothetical protein C4J81_06315 [Deltaproteobacteria bacterium Smac51]|nr:hypothetical protein C4J81_06315 [Deltaproteobacteria bacterium Smac51]